MLCFFACLQDVFLTSDSYMSMEEGCTATLVLLEADAHEGWVLQVRVGRAGRVDVSVWLEGGQMRGGADGAGEQARLAGTGAAGCVCWLWEQWILRSKCYRAFPGRPYWPTRYRARAAACSTWKACMLSERDRDRG